MPPAELSAEQREKLHDLFSRSVELDAAGRASFCARECGDDAVLRAELEELLATSDRSNTFLSEPVLSGAAEPSFTTISGPVESDPELIDNYRVLGRIGEGGMGVVYRAREEQPVRREVALKVIKLGMDTREVIARFETERQALAMMDHPSIAKVLGGGATPAGRPYFAMELVGGVPITQYCQEAGLGIVERLELFQQVCYAVQHAHQKGVIHRDLKPSNILITLLDGVPIPKVIDFGIAKATSSEQVRRTVLTDLRQVIGTPEYMAPEQAQPAALDIDTRADVYSLGVLLYELLTGSKPFDTTKLMEQGYIEVLRVIREEEPQKPSTRIDACGTSMPDQAGRGHTSARTLFRQVRGDLDWIVMKALAKDRGRRYATANDLAADIGRYLHHEPVEAGPPSGTYRLRKYLRRHRVGVFAGGAVAAAILAGLTAAAWGYFEAREQRERAEDAETAALGDRDDALRAAGRADSVATLLLDMLNTSNPLISPVVDPDMTVLEMLGLFDRFLSENPPEDPDVEVTIRQTMAEAYKARGSHEDARRNFERALAIRIRQSGERHPQVAALRDDLASELQLLGQAGEAEILIRQALAGRLEQHGESAYEVAQMRNNLAVNLGLQSRHGDALAELQLAIPVARNHGDRRELATALTNLGDTLFAMGETDAAEAAYLDAEAMERELQPSGRPALATILNNYSRVLRQTHHFDEAEDKLREAIDIYRRYFGEDHEKVFLGRRNLCLLLMKAGADLSSDGRNDDAKATLLRGLEVAESLPGENHDLIAPILRNMGSAHEAQRDWAGAESWYARSLESYLQFCPRLTPEVAKAMFKLGVTRMNLNDFGGAEPLLEDGLAIWNELGLGDDQNLANGLAWMGVLAGIRGEWESAASISGRCADMMHRVYGEVSPGALFARENQAVYLQRLGDFAGAKTAAEHFLADAREMGDPMWLSTATVRLGDHLLTSEDASDYRLAEALLRDGEALRARLMPDTYLHRSAKAAIGRSLALQGKPADAEPLLLAGIEGAWPPGPPTERKQLIRRWLVELYEGWGKPEQAAKWR